jgi:hypothetical protein
MALNPDVVLSPFAGDSTSAFLTQGRLDCRNPTCSNRGTKKCGKCNSARYCSRECQMAHWKEHKQVCHHPTAQSTFVGELPQSWVGNARMEVSDSTRENARTVFDMTGWSDDEGLAIHSMAERAGFRGYHGFDVPGTDGEFEICISGGVGVFLSNVLPFYPPPFHPKDSQLMCRNSTNPFLVTSGRNSINTMRVDQFRYCWARQSARWAVLWSQWRFRLIPRNGSNWFCILL